MNNRRRRYGARRPEFRIENDSDAVFDEAIRTGVLSEDPGQDNFVGHYMYMYHDAGGAAWFKHRETRAYVTMPPQAPLARTGRGPKRLAILRIGLLATAGLAGAFLVGGLLDIGFGGPDVGTVRLNDLTAEFLAGAVRGADSPEASAQAARTWGVELERALEAVAERHGVALLPTEAVATGARDYTDEVRAAMRWAAPGGAAHGETAYGDAAHGNTAHSETGSTAEPDEQLQVGPGGGP